MASVSAFVLSDSDSSDSDTSGSESPVGSLSQQPSVSSSFSGCGPLAPPERAPLCSSFEATEDSVAQEEGGVVLKMRDGDTLTFAGDVSVQVVQGGSVRCLGAVLPSGSAPVSMHCSSRDPRALLQLRASALEEPTTSPKAARVHVRVRACGKRGTSREESHTFRGVCGFHPLLGLEAQDPTFRPLQIDDSWMTALEKVESAVEKKSADARKTAKSRFHSVAVVGPRNSGKSTLARFLCNGLLNRHKAVLWVETDAGQPQFGAEGVLALTLVQKPLFGGRSTTTPLHAVYVGTNTPADAPMRFRSCLRELSAALHEFAAERQRVLRRNDSADGYTLPVIVNTHGWVQGFGKQVLGDVLRLFSVGHVVELTDMSDKTRIFQSNELPAECMHMSVPRQTQIYSKDSRVDRRHNSLLAYLTNLSTASLNSAAAARVLRHAPVRLLPFAATSLCFAFGAPERGHALHAITACVVALAARVSGNDDSECAHSYEEHGLRVCDGTPRHRCLGLALVRAIDVTKGILGLVTPLSAQELATCDLVIRGLTPTPARMLWLGATVGGRHVTDTPFLSHAAAALSTAQHFRGRAQLKRGRPE